MHTKGSGNSTGKARNQWNIRLPLFATYVARHQPRLAVRGGCFCIFHSLLVSVYAISNGYHMAAGRWEKDLTKEKITKWTSQWEEGHAANSSIRIKETPTHGRQNLVFYGAARTFWYFGDCSVDLSHMFRSRLSSDGRHVYLTWMLCCQCVIYLFFIQKANPVRLVFWGREDAEQLSLCAGVKGFAFPP